MSDELIPIGQGNIGGEAVNTVNARDLHEFLESKAEFANWIKQQIERTRLVEDKHFVRVEGVSDKIVKNPSAGGRPRTEYFLTIDAGKHVAMMSGTDKGFEVRDYFLECERRLQNPAANLTRVDFARMVIEESELRKALEAKVESLEPKAQALERIAMSDGNMCLRLAAKNLGMPPKQFNQWLMKLGWIFKQNGRGDFQAYQKRIQSLELDHKVAIFKQPDGTDRTASQVVVTPKGLARLSELQAREPFRLVGGMEPGAAS